MPRPLRPIDDGLIYRGNNRQGVFHKPDDFQAFLRALADLKARMPFVESIHSFHACPIYRSRVPRQFYNHLTT
jgi:hypothetical protein